MTHHRFNLSNSSFEEIKTNKDNYKTDMSGNDQYKSDLGHSAKDWAKKLGFGKKKTQKVLRNWLYEGKCRVIKVPITDVTGRANYTFYYVLENYHPITMLLEESLDGD